MIRLLGGDFCALVGAATQQTDVHQVLFMNCGREVLFTGFKVIGSSVYNLNHALKNIKTWLWLKKGWKAQSFAQMPLFPKSFISNH